MGYFSDLSCKLQEEESETMSFECADCVPKAILQAWPSMMQSYGPCETCDQERVCYDVRPYMWAPRSPAVATPAVHVLHPYLGGYRLTWCEQRVFEGGNREPILAYSHDDAQITCAACIERRQDAWVVAGFVL